MSYLGAGIVAFFLAVIQASALPYWHILGVTPDVVLIFAVCWAMLRGQREAMVVVPMVALLRDLVTSDPLGTSLLALSPIVPLASLRELKVVETDFLPTLLVVLLGSLAYGLISMTVLAVTGHEIPWLTALRVALLPSLVVNVLFTPVIYLPMRGLIVLWKPAARAGPTLPV